jgi:hypothetical protein
MLGISCAVPGTFPAFIVGMFNLYFAITLCIAVNSSAILDPLLGRNGYQRQTFTIGPFKFTLHAENRENEFLLFDIMHNDIAIIFQILPIDTLQECGPHSNLNCIEFLWNHLALLNIPWCDHCAKPLFMFQSCARSRQQLQIR